MADLRFAFRQLLKNPGFTTVAVLTLALGIGANTAIFSLIDHVMLRLLPVRNPEELVVLPRHLSYPRYQRVRDLNDVFSGIFGAHLLPNMAVGIPGQSEGQAVGELVSGQRRAVLGLILKSGMRLTLLGVIIGLGGAVALTRLIKSQLHEVSAIDPLTFAAVVGGLITITLFACWLPARRAARLDPMEALRYE
jgi:FtsX-like permease family